MKYIFSILLIFSFNISFSQMTVSEMMRVYKMDMDQFETFAINKGYKFYKFQKDENTYGHTYKKGYGENIKYLTLYSRFYSKGIYVYYQTSNSNEYLIFKNQLKNFGFVLTPSIEEVFRENPYKVYRNKTYEIDITTGNNGNFEIGLNK